MTPYFQHLKQTILEGGSPSCGDRGGCVLRDGEHVMGPVPVHGLHRSSKHLESKNGQHLSQDFQGSRYSMEVFSVRLKGCGSV